MQLEQDNYCEIGTIDDIVISQSSLAKIDPARGGSPGKFKDFFVNRLDKPTTAMLRGTIFHKYAEDSKAFAVSEAIKPSEKLGNVADAVAQVYDSLEDEQSKSEFMMMLDSNILKACRALNWNGKWKDEAIIKNAAPVGAYLMALNDPANKGKIILTEVMKVQIENCIESLKRNELGNRILTWKATGFDNLIYYKELDIFWEERFGDSIVKCKAKIDDIIIDPDKKTIEINDLKTTGGSAYNFEGTFKQYRLDVQFAMYTRAIKAKFPEYADYNFIYRNIVVETSGLFETVVHRWSKAIIKEANDYLGNLFYRFLHAKKNGYTKSIEEDEGNGEIRHLVLMA